jgi:hypothetical protein
MPVAAQVGGAERHDHDMAGTSSYLLITAGTHVILARLERLDTPELGHRASERVLCERDRPRGRGSLADGLVQRSPRPARGATARVVIGMIARWSFGAVSASARWYHEA